MYSSGPTIVLIAVYCILNVSLIHQSGGMYFNSVIFNHLRGLPSSKAIF